MINQHMCKGKTGPISNPFKYRQAPERLVPTLFTEITLTAQRSVKQFNCPEIIKNLLSEQKMQTLKITVAEQIIPKRHHLFYSKISLDKNQQEIQLWSLKLKKCKMKRGPWTCCFPSKERIARFSLTVITEHVPTYLTEPQRISWPLSEKTHY